MALLVKCREATIRGWAEQHFGTAAAGALLAGRTTAPDLALGIFTGGGGSSGFIMDVARHGSGNSGGGGGDGATGHQAGGDGDCSELDGLLLKAPHCSFRWIRPSPAVELSQSMGWMLCRCWWRHRGAQFIWTR